MAISLLFLGLLIVFILFLLLSGTILGPRRSEEDPWRLPPPPPATTPGESRLLMLLGAGAAGLWGASLVLTLAGIGAGRPLRVIPFVLLAGAALWVLRKPRAARRAAANQFVTAFSLVIIVFVAGLIVASIIYALFLLPSQTEA